MIDRILDELEECIDAWFPTREIKLDVLMKTAGEYYE